MNASQKQVWFVYNSDVSVVKLHKFLSYLVSSDIINRYSISKVLLNLSRFYEGLKADWSNASSRKDTKIVCLTFFWQSQHAFNFLDVNYISQRACFFCCCCQPVVFSDSDCRLIRNFLNNVDVIYKASWPVASAKMNRFLKINKCPSTSVM